MWVLADAGASQWVAPGTTAAVIVAIGGFVAVLVREARNNTAVALDIEDKVEQRVAPRVEAAVKAEAQRRTDQKAYYEARLTEQHDYHEREITEVRRQLAAMTEARDHWQARAEGRPPPPPPGQEQP
jgi:uncharacterized protein HemX